MLFRSDLERNCLEISNHTLRSQRRTIVASFLLLGWLFDINKNRCYCLPLQAANTTTIRGDRKQYNRGLKVWLVFLTLIVCSECLWLKILQPKELPRLCLLKLLLLSNLPYRLYSIHLFPQDCNLRLLPKHLAE